LIKSRKRERDLYLKNSFIKVPAIVNLIFLNHSLIRTLLITATSSIQAMGGRA